MAAVKRRTALVRAGLLASIAVAPMADAQTPAAREHAPVIDMHLHALHANDQGPFPQFVCAGEGTLPAPWLHDAWTLSNLMSCPHPLQSAPDDARLMRETFAMMRRFNVRGVTSGSIALVRQWRAAEPRRVIAGITDDAPLDSIARWVQNGDVAVLGELAFQYGGVGPGDSVPERWIALAEQLDVPIGIHVGPGPPGAPYIGAPGYRMRLSNALLLEDVLVRHPKARVYVMHAGWPFADEMIALMWAHPQVYVDLAVIDWAVPEREFNAYLTRLVNAGMGERIMYGSDQMVWPQAIAISIDRIEHASYLTRQQKRDILYENAARFLRLPEARR